MELHFRKTERDQTKIEINLNPVFKFPNPKNFLAVHKI